MTVDTGFVLLADAGVFRGCCRCARRPAGACANPATLEIVPAFLQAGATQPNGRCTSTHNAASTPVPTAPETLLVPAHFLWAAN
jgi:hypothetical protein